LLALRLGGRKVYIEGKGAKTWEKQSQQREARKTRTCRAQAPTTPTPPPQLKDQQQSRWMRQTKRASGKRGGHFVVKMKKKNGRQRLAKGTWPPTEAKLTPFAIVLAGQGGEATKSQEDCFPMKSVNPALAHQFCRRKWTGRFPQLETRGEAGRNSLLGAGTTQAGRKMIKEGGGNSRKFIAFFRRKKWGARKKTKFLRPETESRTLWPGWATQRSIYDLENQREKRVRPLLKRRPDSGSFIRAISASSLQGHNTTGTNEELCRKGNPQGGGVDRKRSPGAANIERLVRCGPADPGKRGRLGGAATEEGTERRCFPVVRRRWHGQGWPGV